MSFKYSLGVRSHAGRVARHNEDHFVVDEQANVFFLADGMGGHVAGQQASQLACRAAYTAYCDGSALVDCIEAAHQAILLAIAENSTLRGMGTTLLALAFDGIEFELAWVGDSRAYRWQAGHLLQLSRDHNYAQALMADGMSAAQAWHDPQAARLTQAVGVRDDMLMTVDAIYGRLYRDEYLLLCSDGLTDELEDEAIAALIAEAGSVESICDRLLQAALDHGGRDNITILLIAADPSAPVRPQATLQPITKPWYQRLMFWKTF